MPDQFNFQNFFQEGLIDANGNLPSSRFKCSFSLFGRHHLIGGYSMYGLGNKHFILENDSVEIQPDLILISKTESVKDSKKVQFYVAGTHFQQVQTTPKMLDLYW